MHDLGLNPDIGQIVKQRYLKPPPIQIDREIYQAEAFGIFCTAL